MPNSEQLQRNTEPLMFNGVEAVRYEYIAQALNVGLRTLYAYASETNAQRLEGFPRPITPAGFRSVLFTKADADRFIEKRLAGSETGKGRVKALPLTKTQLDAVPAAAQILGHDIDLPATARLSDRRSMTSSSSP